MKRKQSGDFVVPQTYNELVARFGEFFSKTLSRINKVPQNQEDIEQEVWIRLLKARFLGTFLEHVEDRRPKVLSALDVCDVLGVSWLQWVTSMSRHHRGASHRWMPTPINQAAFDATGSVGYLETEALYALSDVLRLAKQEKVFDVAGRATLSGCVYGDTREEGALKLPPVKVTKAYFKNYFQRAIRNHYANWCRTKFRRHKERPVAVPAYKRDQESTAWEHTIKDKRAGSEVMVSLSEARRLLSDTLAKCSEGVSLPHPLSEHEAKVVKSLEGGNSIMKALKESELPSRVRKGVLESLRHG